MCEFNAICIYFASFRRLSVAFLYKTVARKVDHNKTNIWKKLRIIAERLCLYGLEVPKKLGLFYLKFVCDSWFGNSALRNEIQLFMLSKFSHDHQTSMITINQNKRNDVWGQESWPWYSDQIPAFPQAFVHQFGHKIARFSSLGSEWKQPFLNYCAFLIFLFANYLLHRSHEWNGLLSISS